MKSKIYLLVLIAGVFWGTIGTFGKLLMNYGFASMEVAFSRLFFGCAWLFLFAFIFERKALKISRKGFLYALVLGVFSQALFNYLYFNSIQRIGIAVAAVLLYTAPIFLAFFSKVIFKEKINLQKKISILLCVIGSFLAVTGGVLDIKILDIVGVGLGIGAALSYAFLSIVSKKAMVETGALTLIMYSFLIGWILLVPIAKPWDIVGKIADFKGLFFVIGQGLFTSALPYMFYMTGVSKGAELTRAGVICSIELIISVVIAWTFFSEAISLYKVIGVLMILVSILIAGMTAMKGNFKKEEIKTSEPLNRIDA